MRPRYWARSLIGWRSFGKAEPNDATGRWPRPSAAGWSACSSRRTSTVCTRRPARAGHRPARPARPGGLPGLPADDWHGPAGSSTSRRSTGSGPVCERPSRRTATPTSTGWTSRRSSCLRARAAAASSSPTWSSSARTCRPGVIPRRPQRCPVRRHARRRVVVDGATPATATRWPPAGSGCRSRPSTSAAPAPTTCSRSSWPLPPARP